VHGFDFVLDQKLVDGDWFRPSIVCRKEINPLDIKYCSMTISLSSELPEDFDSNCLVVKLPKKTYNHQDDKFYSEGLDDTSRQSTIQLFSLCQVGPQSDAFFEYYIFVFGPNMEFNISIFSSVDLVKSIMSTTLHDEDDTGLDYDLVITSIEWITMKD
jgi:hypothetical protein